MDHHNQGSGGGMMMDMDDMDDGTIDVLWIPQVYWIFVGAVVAAFALVNISNYLLYRQRLRAAAKGYPDPARPHNFVTQALAGATALGREVSNLSLESHFTRIKILGWISRLPSLGSCFLLMANTAILLTLGFYKLDPSVQGNYQNIAYRWGFLTLGQFPLIFLLAGKENLIGFFTGHSYERLHWLHRWVGRTMLLTATLHMAFWFADWAPYNYIGYQLENDKHFTQTGFAAWCLLVWLVFSSFAPIRSLSYELFYVTHFCSFVAFTALVFIHIPASDHTWLWVPVGVYFFDRLVRAGFLAVYNISLFHPRKTQDTKSLLSCYADLTPLPGQMTRITIRDPPISWRAGQHVRLSTHGISPLQTHPFTVASLPSDGKMEFIIKAHTGGTRRFLNHAEKSIDLPSHRKSGSKSMVSCLVSDPYGSMRPLRQFDSVVLFAGSNGAAFTVPLLRDIIENWKEARLGTRAQTSWTSPSSGAVTRRIRFVWIVKSGDHLVWFASQLRQVLWDVQELRKDAVDVGLHMSIYVTCDETFTTDWSNASSKQENITDRPTLLNQRPPSNKTFSAGEKKSAQDKTTQEQIVREIDPRSESVSSASDRGSTRPRACRPDGTCCCQTVVTNELSAPSYACKCNCKAHTESKLGEAGPKPVVEEQDPVKAIAKEDINIISGRPHPRTIIRKTLERARGESAVVVCGPQGLNNDVRRNVISLSDERAAGRATGAQGVWFWGEGFGY